MRKQREKKKKTDTIADSRISARMGVFFFSTPNRKNTWSTNYFTTFCHQRVSGKSKEVGK